MKHKSIDSQKHALTLDYFFSKASHLRAPHPLKKTKGTLYPSGAVREKSLSSFVSGKINTLMLLGFCSIISETG